MCERNRKMSEREKMRDKETKKTGDGGRGREREK